MQLEGVRISWTSKDKANTGWESCQWVGRGAVQSSPCRGLARGAQIGTTMGENRGKTQGPIKVQKTKSKKGGHPRGAYTKQKKNI